MAGPCSPGCKCYLQTSLLAVGGCSKQAFLLWHRDILQQPLVCAAAIWKSEQGRSWASKKRLMQPVTNTVVHSLWLIPAVHARGLSSAANPLLLGSPCWLTRSGRPRRLPCAAGETSPGWLITQQWSAVCTYCCPVFLCNHPKITRVCSDRGCRAASGWIWGCVRVRCCLGPAPLRLPGGHSALRSHPRSLSPPLFFFPWSCFALEGELVCGCLNAAICCFLKDF